jgi:hypothetical protein
MCAPATPLLLLLPQVRTQSRGRARVRGSRFLSLLGWDDLALHSKAATQEASLQAYLRGLAEE